MRISENVLTRHVEDEAVLLDLGTGSCYTLNATGRRIWSMLSEGSQPEEIVNELVARFDADPERIRTEVNGIVEKLRERGLVEDDGGPAGS